MMKDMKDMKDVFLMSEGDIVIVERVTTSSSQHLLDRYYLAQVVAIEAGQVTALQSYPGGPVSKGKHKVHLLSNLPVNLSPLHEAWRQKTASTPGYRSRTEVLVDICAILDIPVSLVLPQPSAGISNAVLMILLGITVYALYDLYMLVSAYTG